MVCQQQGGGQVVLIGEGLGPIVTGSLTDSPDARLPQVRLEPLSGLVADSPPASDEVVVLDGEDPHLHWVGTDQLELQVDQGLGLSAGVYDVVVRAVDGREAWASAALAVTDAPVLSALDPGGVCHGSVLTEVQISGSGFLFLDEIGSPVLQLDGVELPITARDGCEALAGPLSGEICTRLSFEIETEGLTLGDLAVVVTNPEPAACVSTDSLALEITPEPRVDEVSPEAVCVDGGSFEVHGAWFPEGTTVDLGEDVVVASVERLDEGTLLVTLDPQSGLGLRDLTVIAPGACTDTLPDAITLAGEPLVFAVDPAVIWSGASVVATAWISDVVGEITDLWLEPLDGGADVVVAWSWDPLDPGRVEISLPAGLADGGYAVRVLQSDGCAGEAAGTLTVTSTLSVALEGIDPAQAWTWTHTPVTLSATSPLPAGESGFLDAPTVYLVGADGSAARLLGLRYRDEATLTATIPAELAVGTYDVLLVNPDGGLGLLEGGLEVVADAPPTISSVTPPSLPKSSDQPVDIRGRDFRDPSVAITCQEGGVESTAAATVDSWTFSHIEATVPSTSFNQAVCVVEVTNDDGTSARFAAISITNPAQNLFPWQDGPALQVGRRAPGVAAGRVSSVSRYVYAIGGDQGEETSALDSIEAAAIGVYGDLGDWSLLARTLPEPWTLGAATTIGRFVYTVGGSDGAGAVATVRRALILDPLDVPQLIGVNVGSAGGEGLVGGLWVYRVSALFDPTWSANPDGESAASEPLSLTLPSVEGGLAVTLSWSAFEGAAGYRIYRSPAADSGSGTEARLADITDSSTTFTDWGEATDASAAPAEDGALGAWAQVSALTQARLAPCVTWVADPAPDPEIVWLYAAGGEDASGSKLDSIEALDITIEAQDRHAEGSWSTISTQLSEARSHCGAWTVDSRTHSVVEDDESWVFFGGGETRNKTTGTAEGGLVLSGGAITDWGKVDSLSPARSGFGVASASDFLYAFGGQQGSPSASGVSAELDPPLPSLSNWNSLGTSMSEARHLPGSAQESAVIVIVGGETDSSPASTTTDWTNF